MNRMRGCLVVFLILLALCLCAAASAEVEYSSMPKNDTLYLFWQPVKGEAPPAPQVKVKKDSVTITGLGAYGVPAECMQTYKINQAWGTVPVGTAPEDTVIFQGKPNEMDLSFDTDGTYVKIELYITESKEYKGHYFLSLRMTDRKGRVLSWDPEDGSCMIEYGKMSAEYGPDGMLLRADYTKEDKKARNFYKYERIESELPVFRLTYVSYTDQKTHEVWSLNYPKDNTKSQKHIDRKNLPFTVKGQNQADKVMAKRKANGITWLSAPSEEAAYMVMQTPSYPKCKYKTDNGIMTVTLSGLGDLHIPAENMRTWTWKGDEKKGSWKASGKLQEDRIVFKIPVDGDYEWELPADSSAECGVSISFSPWLAETKTLPVTIDIKSKDKSFNCTLCDSGRHDGFSPYIYIGNTELQYSPEGYLRQYKVWADNVVYTYEYSSLSGSLILDRFDVWKEGKQEASYERDINDYWYVRDASGNKTACDRPEAADRCPPLPVR